MGRIFSLDIRVMVKSEAVSPVSLRWYVLLLMQTGDS